MAEIISTYTGPSRFPSKYDNPNLLRPLKLPCGKKVDGLVATVFHKMIAISAPMYALSDINFKRAVVPENVPDKDFWDTVHALCEGDNAGIRLEEIIYGENAADKRNFVQSTSPEVTNDYQIGLRTYLDRELSAFVIERRSQMPRYRVISDIAHSSIFQPVENPRLVRHIVRELLMTSVKEGKQKIRDEVLDITTIGALGALGFHLMGELKKSNFNWDDIVEEVGDVIGEDSGIDSRLLHIATRRSLLSAGYLKLRDSVIIATPGRPNTHKDESFSEVVLPTAHPLKGLARPVENLLIVSREILGQYTLEDIKKLREAVQRLIQSHGFDIANLDRIAFPKINSGVNDAVALEQKEAILRGAFFILDFIRWRQTGRINGAGAPDAASYINFDLALEAVEKSLMQIQDQSGEPTMLALIERSKSFIKKQAGVK